MVTRDDSWELTLAVTGDPELATDTLFLSHIVGAINALREERDHLINQLKAADEHVEVMAGKYAFKTAMPWLRHDFETLRRLLALHTPAWRQELEKTRRGLAESGDDRD
jgi:hypothetical protein